jgi:drug/metabolite transporter (DMT)-like permease
MRLAIIAIVVAIVLNKNLKAIVVNSIPVTDRRKVLLISCSNTAVFFLIFSSIASLPLVEVALIVNTVPLF